MDPDWFVLYEVNMRLSFDEIIYTIINYLCCVDYQLNLWYNPANRDETMNETFGSKMREKRRSVGVTQRDLADRIGVDFSYISKVENDRLPPPAADTIVAICKVLNIEPEELLAIKGKIPSDIQETISTKKSAQEFLRQAQRMNLSESEWEAMLKPLNDLRK